MKIWEPDVKRRVYIETSIVSYLTAKPSRDLLAAAWQEITVALAAVHHMDYLLTWNCRHIDNAEMIPTIRATVLSEGYSLPEICTPLELMGEEADER